MIIKCAWHPERYGVELVMGVKEPYDDKSVSHSICYDCMIAVQLQTLIDVKRKRFDEEWDRFNRMCA